MSKRDDFNARKTEPFELKLAECGAGGIQIRVFFSDSEIPIYICRYIHKEKNTVLSKFLMKKKYCIKNS